MKRFRYTVELTVNSEGYVAQDNDIYRFKKIHSFHGYFSNNDVLEKLLKKWSRQKNYKYYLTEDDKKFNSNTKNVRYTHPKNGHSSILAFVGPNEESEYIIIED